MKPSCRCSGVHPEPMTLMMGQAQATVMSVTRPMAVTVSVMSLEM